MEDPAHVATNLLGALHPPFVFDGHEVFETASIGITIYPSDSTDAGELLKNADLAMYRAKSRGGDAYEFYAREMTAQTAQRLDMENKLRHAIERNEFCLHYQPRANIHSGEIAAFEALLRWRQPELGSVGPDVFVPVLEETGLIGPVGEWVLRTACSYVRQMKDSGRDTLRVAVNLSARQFRDKDLVKSIARILQDTGLEGRDLELEITESLLVENIDTTTAMLNELHAMGIQISIDDFGTGYASMAYIKRFPIDTLKIDRAFIRDLTTDADDRSIVTAIIAMARSLGYSVVAEGVETKEQLAFLRLQGCDELQGYFLSRPLNGEALDAWLALHGCNHPNHS